MMWHHIYIPAAASTTEPEDVTPTSPATAQTPDMTTVEGTPATQSTPAVTTPGTPSNETGTCSWLLGECAARKCYQMRFCIPVYGCDVIGA
jgi:hypothetical protein